MKKRLSLKFLLVFLLFGLGSFVFLAVAGERLFQDSARHTAARELYRDALTLAAAQSEYYAAHRQLDVDSLNTTASASGHRILILNPQNLVIFDSAGTPADRTLAGFDPAETSSFYRIGSFYGAFSETTVSVFSPISADFTLLGYLTIHQPASVADARANDFLARAFQIYLVIFLFSLLIYAALYFWVLRPVRKIAEGAGEFAAGHMDYRIQVRADDEVGYLAESLNEMARQLQSADESQKRFIANISHDFRSPLTSIRGYLQAMADGVIPTDSQEKYFNIVIGETERLTNLTQSMLSLNSLDEARLGLELSDFDLVRTVRSVCETFEGVCQKKGITFDLIFGAPVITVHADLGRINQALHNLIDNAIKFSYENGVIRIRLQEVGEKVSVSVKDFGCGIEKDDLGRIWTRFYKSDTSRGKDKKGTGLGLSITREIIASHGETIDVTSTPGSGTEFIFRLPLAKKKE